MTASWRPALWLSCAFNADPNDPSIVSAWSDLSSPFFIGADSLQRGRQYELDQNQASQPSFTFLDQSEALNPDNALSPYAPNVLPLRQILFQAMWPNQATGNLMNANQGASSILGTTSAGYDSSFESYAVGSTVPWIDAVGGTTPTVVASSPHSGAQCLSYPVTTAATEQGVTWTVPAVPGQQYTAQAWVRQTSATAQTLAVGGLTAGVDAFNRTASNGWGTADVGGAWATSGGSSSDYSVTAGMASMSLGSVNVARMTTLGASGADCDVRAYVSVPVTAAGAAIRAGVVGRWTSSSNFYRASADFNTDNSVTFTIWKRVAGTETSLTSTTMSFPYGIDTFYGLRLQVVGTTISASMWQSTDTMPTTATLTATDSALTGVGNVGCWTRLQTGNTNSSPVVISYQNFGATYTASGSSTSTINSYVQLTATFTATAPTHSIGVLALAGATAGTVRIDDLQYEQGASASAFTTSGPNIWGVFRGSVERWPSEWLNAGFLGLCEATAVDAFEALNLYTLNSEYFQQVFTLGPAFYWSLGDSSGSTIYGEQSGNNGPPLINVASKYGGGTPPQAGVPLNIAGDPGGTGITITPSDLTGVVITEQTTIPIVGAQQGGQLGQFSWPAGAGGPSWSASIAAWFIAAATGTSDQYLVWTSTPGNSTEQALTLAILGSTGQIIGNAGGATNDVAAVGGPSVFDGLPHLAVVTASQVSSGNTTCTVYLDGTQVNTQTVTTASLGGVVIGPSTAADVGGLFYWGKGSAIPPQFWHILNGQMAHVALWDRALSSAEVTALWAAGGGNSGETSGTRVARYVASAWNGLTDVDTGSSVMGISTVTTGTSVLQACQDVTTTEQGNFWADKDGVVTFAGRQDRYLNTTSRYTFGELESLGEYPYEEGLAYDFDPTFVYGQVVVNNADGVTASVSNQPSQRAYFPRTYTAEVNLLSDLDAEQWAYWQLNKHDQPVQRIQSITLDPMGNPNLWTVVLSLEIGDRVTVVRRPKAANGGAGLTMTGDFFIENISHNGVDLAVQTATWKTTLLLSPAQLTSDVFIFDNATYGVFDGPGVFAL